MTKIPKGISPGPIYAQMQKLEALKMAAEREFGEMEQSGACADKPVALKEYREYLKAVRAVADMTDSAADRAKIVKRLVAKVEVLPGTFRLHYYVGRAHIFASGVPGTVSLPATAAGECSSIADKGLNLNGLEKAKKNLDIGSNSLTNGGPDADRTRDLQNAIFASD